MSRIWEYTDAEKAGHEMLKYLNRDANLARAYLNDEAEGAYTDESDVIIPFIKIVFSILNNWTKFMMNLVIVTAR